MKCKKIRFDILCKWSLFEIISIKCQPYFQGEIKKIFQNVICLNVYPAESIIILTSSLVVKMLTVSVRTISNSQVFLVKKKVWVALAVVQN